MDGCIEWEKYRRPTGYGVRRYKGQLWQVHRLAWFLEHGPIPDGRYVLHRCHNPPCYNVDHLYLGDQRTNMLDARDHHGVGGQVLTKQHVFAVKWLATFPEVFQNDIAWAFGVQPSQVSRIVNGKRWNLRMQD